MNPTLIEKLKEVVTVLSALPGCSPVSVGGSVRDAVILGGTKNIESSLEFASKDFDLEVFGATSASVYAALKGADIDVELVGRNFPVYKVHGWEIDISFPRLETKTGDGHTDFSIVVDSGMTFKAGAERRDFSVNAIGYDWKTKTLLDPYNGIKDIEAKMHVLHPKTIHTALGELKKHAFILAQTGAVHQPALHIRLGCDYLHRDAIGSMANLWDTLLGMTDA